MGIGFSLTILGVLGLLVAAYKESQMGIWISKPLASLGFLLAAYSAGALQTTYGIIVFVALILSWWGDVLLIPKSQKIFTLGILSFLLGHVAFTIAFLTLGFNWLWAFGAFVVVVPIVYGVSRWLLPHVESDMRIPVFAYIFVIATMAVTSIATYPSVRSSLIPLAAIAFFVSDLAVARHRFVQPSFSNRLWGLPLYYGAQLLFAVTTVTYPTKLLFW